MSDHKNKTYWEKGRVMIVSLAFLACVFIVLSNKMAALDNYAVDYSYFYLIVSFVCSYQFLSAIVLKEVCFKGFVFSLNDNKSMYYLVTLLSLSGGLMFLALTFR